MLRLLNALAVLLVLTLTGCATSRGDAQLQTAFHGEDESRLIVVTVDNTLTPAPPQPGGARRGYSGGAYTGSDTARSTMAALARDFGLTEVAAWPIAVLQVHCAVFRISPAASRDELLQKLMSDPRVQLAQQMNGFESRGTAYNDPYVEMQTGFRSIDAAAAQQWSRGEHVRVAVVDTGIDAQHPDFGGRISVRRNFVDRDAAQFDRDRHGTAVAGVISAAANNKVGIVGVAPAVEIVALKACWQLAADSDAARCNSLTLAQALLAAMDEHVQIVNLSLTGPNDPLLNALIAAGARRGILYVGAAPFDSEAGFPGSAPEVIPVDTAGTQRTREGVLRAPGSEIVTLMPGGRYDFVSGSSLATAHVTGAIALLLARAPRLDRAAAYGLLLRSESGASINACSALASLIKQGDCAGATTAATSVACASRDYCAAR